MTVEIVEYNDSDRFFAPRDPLNRYKAYELHDELKDWIKQNVHGLFNWRHDVEFIDDDETYSGIVLVEFMVFSFEIEEEAMLFKLTWL